MLEAATRSGLSLHGFARQQGMDPDRLYRWREKLNGTRVGDEDVRFEELQVDGGDGAKGDDERMEIMLASGHTVRVGAHFDERALRRLLEILDGREMSC